MTSEWKNYKIKDVLSYVVDNRGKTPPIQDEGFELLEVNAISATEKFPQYQLVRKHVSEHVYNTWFRSGHPQIGDILVPTVGTLGAVSYVNKDNCCIAQNLIALRANKDICDCDYLYYILRNPNTRKRLLNLNIGGVQPSIKVPHLMDLEIGIPPVEIQKKIISILKVLDDKISINQKTNDNLQQQAAAIFANFYDRAETEVGFTEIIQILGGGTPKTGESSYWNGNVPFFTPKDVGSPYTLTPEKTITEEGLAHCNSRLYPVNTVFVTARGTVGKVGLPGIPMAMNQSCYALVGKDTHQLLVYFYTLKAVDRLKHKASGAVFDAITTRDFESEIIMKLSDDDTKDFLNVAEPIYQAVLSNSIENLRLASLRDSLLPKLMTGEIDVSDIQL